MQDRKDINKAETVTLMHKAASYYRQGHIDKAERFARQVFEADPAHGPACHLLGLIASQQGDHEKATSYLDSATRASPGDPSVYLSLGAVLFRGGNLEEAVVAMRQAITLKPDAVEAHVNLAAILQELGRPAESLVAAEQAIRLAPESAEAHINHGIAQVRLERREEALDSFVQAIRLCPDSAVAHNFQGNVLRELGRLTEALASYEQAIRLQPDHAGAHNNYGLALMDLDRLQEALAAFDRAAGINARLVEVHINRGNVLKRLGHPEAALAASGEAIRLQPQSAEAHNCSGTILVEMQRFVAALAAYQRAIQLQPDFAEAHINFGNMQFKLGHPDKAEASLRRGLELAPADAAAHHSNLLFIQAAQARLSPVELREGQQRWDQIHGRESRRHALAAAHVEPLPGRRLRVGYVSPDLHQHVVSYFFEPLLAAHDASRVEVFCYASHPGASTDHVTRRLQGMAEHWRDVYTLSNRELAELIYRDRIDILVDLAGHTAGSRLQAFTYRPAPVQATYLGYFASTGLEAMDYWITDEVLHPSDTAERPVENIYRLPRCWLCYQPPAEAAELTPCPNPGERVVFGSFCNISKLTAGVLETWARLLAALPESRLLLMDKPMVDPQTRQYLYDRCLRHGIPGDRLDIQEGVPMVEYFAQYARVDVILDPFPRTGGTLTADALWMGVPVVTLAGKRYVERISASKLVAVGLDDLIAQDREDYIAKVVALARDPARRAGLRSGLRNRMAQSALCDRDSLARAMEAAYLTMWEEHVSKK